jgi:hypothetical protein
LLVLKVDELVAEVQRPQTPSKQFQHRLYTFMSVARVHRVMVLLAGTTVVERLALATTMKAQAEDPQILERACW